MTDPASKPDADSEQSENRLRAAIKDAMVEMRRLGLNHGTAGNVSVRWGTGLLISPSGVRVEELNPEQIVHLPDRRSGPIASGGAASRPSSEWRLHAAILDARADANAVVHCHSRFATVLACAHKPIPAIHYLVALCGANQVPVAPYARFGTEELAQHASDALAESDACLLANHGLVACGHDIDAALNLAEEIEEQAAIYWHSLAIGGAITLDNEQMKDVLGALDDYRHGMHSGGAPGSTKGL